MADAVRELTDLSHTLLVAIRERDRQTLDAVVSADFTITDLAFEFLSIDVSGGTGVVCGVQRATVRLSSGEEVIGKTAFTDVFVQAGAAWLLRVATSADLPVA